MIQRTLEENIKKHLGDGKAIIIMGARQVGKTTLLKQLFYGRKDVLWLNGDEQDVRNIFENANSTRLKLYIGDNNIVVIDEAQRIKEVGLKLKLITDQIPNVKLIATGSSSFDLANQINEPLTGRKWEFKMFPLSFEEMVKSHGMLEEKRLVVHRMVYGYYPDVVTHPNDEREILSELANSYLYKDVFSLDKIKKAENIVKLLKAIAYQIGSEVSYNELGQLCGIDPKTVERYVIIMEQAYIIFRLGSFSRNLRNELKSSRKIYFYDTGIRNAIIGAFNEVENRTDAGSLFENFVIAERIKRIQYHHYDSTPWFWRTSAKQEIDYVEETGKDLAAYEIRWNARRKAPIPSSFRNSYPDASFLKITPENIEDFLMA